MGVREGEAPMGTGAGGDMGRYTFQVITRRTDPTRRAAARAAYAAAAQVYRDGDHSRAYPSHSLDECVWVAAVQLGARTWMDGGSCERIAVQRAVAFALGGAAEVGRGGAKVGRETFAGGDGRDAHGHGGEG